MDVDPMLDIEIIEDLYAHKLIKDKHPTVTILTGGVSSDVMLIESQNERFVLKRALPRLRVEDEWYVDVRRNDTEYACLCFLAEITPDAAPKVLFHNTRLHYFCMEYLGAEYTNYKTLLLSGDRQPSIAHRAGSVLAVVHRQSWKNEQVAADFETTDQFWALRLDPYLVTAGDRNPALKNHLLREADRIASTRLALVLGDFSPKNILVNERSLIVLDCEAAWYGEPAFDVSFFLNHFMLKAIYLPQRVEQFLSFAEAAWEAYLDNLGVEGLGMDKRIAKLLPMLMLARVDGKSTVEYLSDATKKSLVRGFAHQQILEGNDDLSRCLRDWGDVVKTQFHIENT